MRVILGVALVVRNPEGNILILREFEDKPHIGKYRGMFSIPMETSEPGETENLTLTRLVDEELPGLNGKVEICEKRLGVYCIVPNVIVTLYTAAMFDSILPISSGGEVGDWRWICPRDALGLCLRQGAKEMLLDYLLFRSFRSNLPSLRIY